MQYAPRALRSSNIYSAAFQPTRALLAGCKHAQALAAGADALPEGACFDGFALTLPRSSAIPSMHVLLVSGFCMLPRFVTAFGGRHGYRPGAGAEPPRLSLFVAHGRRDGEISWAEIEGGARGAFHRCEEAVTRAWRVLSSLRGLSRAARDVRREVDGDAVPWLNARYKARRRACDGGEPLLAFLLQRGGLASDDAHPVADAAWWATLAQDGDGINPKEVEDAAIPTASDDATLDQTGEWTTVYTITHTLATPLPLARNTRVVVEVDCRRHSCNAAVHNVFFRVAV
mgnify:CR=1 FL=1